MPDNSLLVVGSSPIGLIHAIEQAREGKEVLLIDSNSTIGAAWGSTTVFGERLEFGWHVFSLLRRPERQIEKTINIFSKLGITFERKRSLDSLRIPLIEAEKLFYEVEYLDSGISSPDLVDILYDQAKVSGVKFQFKRKLKFVKRSSNYFSCFLQPTNDFLRMDKVLLPGFVQLGAIDLGDKSVTLPSQARLALHVLISFTDSNTEFLPPLVIRDDNRYSNSLLFDLIGEVRLSTASDAKSKERYLVIRISPQGKELALENIKAYMTKVRNEIISLQIFASNFEINEFKMIGYDICYRTDEDVNRINGSLPDGISLYKTQDVMTAF